MQWPRAKGAPLPSARYILCSFVGSFLSIGMLSTFHYYWLLEDTDYVFIVGSFGAQSVLLFAAISTPLAQPWNAIFGTFISAVIGVCCQKLLNSVPWLAASVAVSLAITVMHLTRSVHPPAGASALIAVIGTERVRHMGFLYVFFPCVLASILNVLFAWAFNTFTGVPERNYPLDDGWCPYTLAAPPQMKEEAEAASAKERESAGSGPPQALGSLPVNAA